MTQSTEHHEYPGPVAEGRKAAISEAIARLSPAERSRLIDLMIRMHEQNRRPAA